MDILTLKKNIKGIDIYILDQILKDNYQNGSKILDAGCGNGRNLKWFYKSNFEIHGTDTDQAQLLICKGNFPDQKENFILASIEQMPYESNSFDHVICSAVLHFANDLSQFTKMFEELLRILKPHGSLFIRTASIFGIENQVKLLGTGIYKLPDGSTRFLLTDDILLDIKNMDPVIIVEDIKTTIVKDKRTMTTILIQKEGK